MKCGFGTFTHSKPAGKKKRKGPAFYATSWKHHSPTRERLYRSGNVYSQNHGYPEKIQAVFSFYISHNWSSEETLVQNEKKTHVKLMEK